MRNVMARRQGAEAMKREETRHRNFSQAAKAKNRQYSMKG